MWLTFKPVPDCGGIWIQLSFKGVLPRRRFAALGLGFLSALFAPNITLLPAQETIVEEFNGAAPGIWEKHAGGYLGDHFTYSADHDMLQLQHATGAASSDSEDRDARANHHLTRKGLRIDPNRPYEIDVEFRFRDRPGFEFGVESFCINVLVQTNPGNLDGEPSGHDDTGKTLEAWSLNVDTINRGIMKRMGFVDELTPDSNRAYGPLVSGHRTSSFTQYDGNIDLPDGYFSRGAMRNKWYRFRVRVHERQDSSVRRGWLHYTLWDNEGIQRADGETDHNRHAFKPRWDNYATIGLNSHFAHWDARNLRVAYRGPSIKDGHGPVNPNLYNSSSRR